MTGTPAAAVTIPEAAPTAPAPLPVRTGRTRPGPRTQAASLLLDPDDTAPARARAAVRDALTQWGLAHLTADAEAITSEIVANAATRSTDATPQGGAPAPVTLHITAADGTLTIRAWDPDPTPPPANPELPDDDNERGRGLIIVGALSQQWGHTPAPNGGKYVFATLATGTHPADPHQQGDTP